MSNKKKISADDLNRLRILFDKYKTDDDLIHEEGLSQLLLAEGSSDPINDARGFIAAADLNKDGFISYGEFLKVYTTNPEDVEHFVKEIIHAQHIVPVEFLYTAPPHVSEVLLAGPWNNWTGQPLQKDHRGVNTYSAIVKLEEGRTHYKYILKGNGGVIWDIDHTKPNENLGGHINNWIDVRKH